MNNWIFQGNPTRFDVDGYLAEKNEIVWLTNQHRELIERGDRVFIWRSDGSKSGSGGVVASGTILGAPSVMPMPPDEIGRWSLSEDAVGPAYRVRILLDEVRTGAKQVVKRSWIESDPILAGMRISKMRSETNYLITPQQAKRISDLLQRTGEDWTPEEVLAALATYVETYGDPISKSPGTPVPNLAVMLGRAVDGCYNKLMNLRAIDPRDKRQGLSSGSRVDQAVWDRYFTAGGLQEEQVRTDYEKVWSIASATNHAEVTEAPDDNLGSKALREVNIRRGQRKFRENLIAAYGGRCAITGCGITSLLEAAHIVPHSVSGVNSVDNGLLLRSDIHTLFDLGLLFVDPVERTVQISQELHESPYKELANTPLRTTKSGDFPKLEYLETRYRLRQAS